MLLINCIQKKTDSKTVIEGLEKIYNNKDNTIEKLCQDRYELFYYYTKNNNKYYKEIKLNRISSNLWIGTIKKSINEKEIKEEIYYKDEKYYVKDTVKEIKESYIKPYFQIDIFKNNEFKVINEVDEIDDIGETMPSLYAIYNDIRSFYYYFSEADIKDKNEDIIIRAKYGDGKKYPNYFEIELESKNERIGERCILKNN